MGGKHIALMGSSIHTEGAFTIQGTDKEHLPFE